MTKTDEFSCHCNKCDKINIYKIPDKIPPRPRMNCIKCGHRFDVKIGQVGHKKPKIESSSGSNSQHSSSIILDDPDELLYSVAIRELNKKNPDPRWANILINCRKENINIKGDVLEQFKQLPTQALVSLLSKKLQEEQG